MGWAVSAGHVWEASVRLFCDRLAAMANREPQTFDLDTSRDMLEKLDREVERIRATDVRADLADHCFNAADGR